MQRRQAIALLGGMPWIHAAARAAVRGDDVMYVGGTLSDVIPEKTKGSLETDGATEAVFAAKGGKVAIPYAKITSLEYGQKAGRRVGVAVAVSPLFLLSKKRKHYLTIGYEDANGAKQGVVFELAKGSVRSVLSTFETRSGKKVEYESEDARKHAGN